jgi:PAS domain-containing protein
VQNHGERPDFRDVGDFQVWDYPPRIPVGGIDPYATPLERAPLDWRLRWPERPGHGARIAVGTGADGTPVMLHLKVGKEVGHQHVLCTGPAGSGKTSFLRTVLVGLADRYSPDRFQFLIADFEQGLGLGAVPHAATAAHGLAEHQEYVDPFVRAVEEELWRRGQLPDLAGEPALVIAIDDVDRLIEARRAFADLLDVIGGEGERLRIHLLLSAVDPSPTPPSAYAHVALAPGQAGLDGRAFRPRRITPEQVAHFSHTFVNYRHPVRSLWSPPEGLTFARLTSKAQGGEGVPIGMLADDDFHDRALGSFGVLSPLFTTLRLDFGARSHLLVRGEPGSGRSTTVRTVLRGLSQTDRASIVLDVADLAPVAERVRAALLQRSTATWSGPDLFLIADDYDTMPWDDDDPLAPLADLLHLGSSIGLHLIATGTAALDRRPLIESLSRDDHMVLYLSGSSERKPPADTVESRAVPFHWPQWISKPIGSARFSGLHEAPVQIALDTEEGTPEFAPLTDLLGRPLPDPAPKPALTAVIGTDDSGDPVTLDVRTHTWCGGWTGSGKSTFLRRVAFSLADRYSPAEVQLVVAEYEATCLAETAYLPNTAEYQAIDDVPGMHRFTALLEDETRRRLSLEARGLLQHAPPLVVLIDQVGLFAVAVPAFADAFWRIAAVGERLGISLIVAATDTTGWSQHRLARIFNRISLMDVSVGAASRAIGVELDVAPGRGEGLLRAGADEPRRFTPATVAFETVCGARFGPWPGSFRAEPVIPPRGLFTYDELVLRLDARDAAFDRVPLGLAGEEPIGLDPDRDPHFVVAGPPGSGRSTVLRTFLRGLPRCYDTSEFMAILLNDNATAGAFSGRHLLSSTAGLEPPKAQTEEVVRALRHRIGSPKRFHGPRLFVVIDDYDRFDPAHDPLAALAELIPVAREIGLHLVLSGDRSLLEREAVTALQAPQLILDEGTLPNSTDDDIPALPIVGRGELAPENLRVTLPWCGQPPQPYASPARNKFPMVR